MEQQYLPFPREESTPAPCAKDPEAQIHVSLNKGSGKVVTVRDLRQQHRDWAAKRAREKFGY